MLSSNVVISFDFDFDLFISSYDCDEYFAVFCIVGLTLNAYDDINY